MAADGERRGPCAGGKQEPSCSQNSLLAEHRDHFRECIGSVTESLAEIGDKLQLNKKDLRVSGDVNVSQLQPSDLYNCLQQHISKLQLVSEKLKQIVESEKLHSSESSVTGFTSSSSDHCTFHEDHNNTQADENVQIKAAKSEIERRISAFIERKQLEINENNVREFCNVINCNQEDSCARTDAVFTPYPGFKSHIKVTRVINTYGPQTRGAHADFREQRQVSLSRDCGNAAVEERLHNMESHLKLPAGPVPQNVYQRLKKLEDRILELEGLSPEYFHSNNYSHKRPKASVSQSCSLAELDGKINAVKAALMKKTNEFHASDSGEFPF
ncbi:hypothetical protein DNTS_023739 [Danionella cerebrum]|uniref:MAP3K12-binding inhibitory protein 1 n=1 Tax=Danionella cerebrum TaxID=2873325 RepID=A0A553QP73_9TELE|nr:hypothetical protein DNTS_023739 [Danionella translucida]